MHSVSLYRIFFLFLCDVASPQQPMKSKCIILRGVLSQVYFMAIFQEAEYLIFIRTRPGHFWGIQVSLVLLAFLKFWAH